MPSARGVWLEVASGQMLRHTPGATMNSSGSAGMTPFHMTNRPVSGTTISSAGDDERDDQAGGADRPPRAQRSRDGICV